MTKQLILDILITTGQGKDYTTGYLLDYDYIKNHYRLIAVGLSRPNKLDADPKAIRLETKIICRTIKKTKYQW